jgi:hypothetical protein
LNQRLAQEREAQRRSEQSFTEYEGAASAMISSLHGDITQLRAQLSGKTLEAQRISSKATLRLVINIVLGAVMAGYAAFRLLRRFKVIGG